MDGNETEEETAQLRKSLESLNENYVLEIISYDESDSLDDKASRFFSDLSDTDTPGEQGRTASDGWSRIVEDEINHFFVLYVDMDFDSDNFSLDELWRDRIENYICSPLLNDEEIWKRFCGNDLSRKRIYISPVRSSNLSTIKSIFKIFLNKQIDDIRLHEKRDVKLRYYLTALNLPYKKGDSSETLTPETSNIYKLAESLKKDRLYLSGDVIELLPLNIRKNLNHREEDGELYSYSFNLMT